MGSPIKPMLAATAIAIALAAIILENAAIERFLPQPVRLTTDFSPTFLRRELASEQLAKADIVFLGDSVLWGYNVRPQDTAVAQLISDGCACINLSYKASSPPNYFALTRLMRVNRIKPRRVVLEVDQRVFQHANSAYATLHPAVAELSGPLLDDADRRALASEGPPANLLSPFQALATSLFTVYAMRSDIREMLYPQPDVIPIQKAAADELFAEFDLTPLDERNAGVHYLIKAIDELRERGIYVAVFMTPTNHQLLHKYIDGPEYQANVDYLIHLAATHGAHVANFDRAFSNDDFYDSSHLKPLAQRRFASMLSSVTRS